MMCFRSRGGLLLAVIACASGCSSEDGPADSGGLDARTDADGSRGDTGAVDGGPTDAGAPRRPLTHHPDNPLYFADATGRAVRLAGHQIFVDLQDNSFNKDFTYGDARELDWAWYLDFATERNLNVIRNWVIWSIGSGTATTPETTARPMMYARTGPGDAVDGQPKFDLYTFDEAFFDRMRTRVQQAGERGIYVTIMLFEVYGFGDGEDEGGQTLWNGNVLNGDNNINGIDVDTDGNGWGTEFFYTTDPALRDLQIAWVDEVIDTLNDLDNVIYEVANELYAPDWQAEIIQHIHDYEASLPMQHLVYRSPGGRTASGDWLSQSMAELFGSGADCFGISLSMGDFENDPPVADGRAPMFWDNDHVWGMDWQHRRRAWMAFTRGYHFILYDAPFENPGMESAAFETMRRNIGATVSYADRFTDLALMNPHGELTSTGYCLADPGSEYLVYQPDPSDFTVELDAGEYTYEWYDPASYAVRSTGNVSVTGTSELFSPPAGLEDAVLYLVAL